MKKFQGKSIDQRKPPKWYSKPSFLIGLVLLTWLTVIPMTIPIRTSLSKFQNIKPQGILVLGGDFNRTIKGVELWKQNRDMNVWVSDFPQSLSEHKREILKSEGNLSKFKLDGRATDTVTNFTTLVEDFESHQLKHIYLVTSQDHMPRSLAIASIVLGSRGILVTPISVPLKSGDPTPWFKEEDESRKQRDIFRSLLWLYFGKTGSSLNPRLP
jgi:uncharacterized SAM-binding protein YcdF (DUF218 family)